MNLTAKTPSVLILLATLGACTQSSQPGQSGDPGPTENHGGTTETTSTRASLDRIARSLDLGDRVAEQRKALDALLATELSQEEREEALTLLSRSAELSGDRERAITALEEILSHHTGSLPERLTKVPGRLEKLLAGHELASSNYEDDDKVAPVAYGLAKYFPWERGKATAVQIVKVDPVGMGSDTSGIFNLAGAIRASAESACPLCDRPSVHTSSSGVGRWSAIPSQVTNMTKGLVVIAYDLGDNHVPSRYASWLAMDQRALDARLSEGQGLIAIKERPSAPPLVVIAAPRTGQLPLVIDTFKNLTALPKEPMSVQLPKGLLAPEIRATVRGHKRDFVTCYESLLARDPKAAGKVALHMSVDGQGMVTQASLGEGTTMHENTYDACVLAAAKALPFPKSGVQNETSIHYPLTFAP